VSDKVPYVRVVQDEIRIKDHMEDVNVILSSPEAFSPPKGIPAVSNVTYRHTYTSLIP